MKGLTEKGIRRLEERGYKIAPIPAENVAREFKVIKGGKPIIVIHFDSEDCKTIDFDEASGTILVLSVNQGYRWFKKLVGIYVTDEGIVLDYMDGNGKNRTVREKENGWILWQKLKHGGYIPHN